MGGEGFSKVVNVEVIRMATDASLTSGNGIRDGAIG